MPDTILVNEDASLVSWIEDRICFMETDFYPDQLSVVKRRFNRVQGANFTLINGFLLKNNFNGIILRCLETEEANRILLEFHRGILGEHFLA